NLSILPGTAFRHEAAELGLRFQPRPPYYLLQTPTLRREDLFGVMQEAQDLFGIEFDAQPPPILDGIQTPLADATGRVDLDRAEQTVGGGTDRGAQACTLWLRAANFDVHRQRAVAVIAQLLDANPFTTLQVVLEVNGATDSAAAARAIGAETLEALMAACQA